MKKRRLREVKKIFQGHTAGKWEIWGSKPVTPKPEILNIMLYVDNKRNNKIESMWNNLEVS